MNKSRQLTLFDMGPDPEEQLGVYVKVMRGKFAGSYGRISAWRSRTRKYQVSGRWYKPDMLAAVWVSPDSSGWGCELPVGISNIKYFLSEKV